MLVVAGLYATSEGLVTGVEPRLIGGIVTRDLDEVKWSYLVIAVAETQTGSIG
jgi:hypothetical protein